MVSAEESSVGSAAEALARALTGVFGAAARSVILHGSLAAGGFRPGRSDLDVLAAVDGGLTGAQAAAIERLVRHADAGGAAGIDLHVVTSEVAAAPSRAPALELHIGRDDRSSAGCEVMRRVPAYPDLLVELSTARADGRALRGAAPRAVVAPVPADWIVDRGRHWLRTWRSRTHDTEHAAFMVLTACRIWHFAVEDAHCSKAGAARWALGRRPRLTAVRQALQWYERDAAQTVDERGTAELLDHVLAETARGR